MVKNPRDQSIISRSHVIFCFLFSRAPPSISFPCSCPSDQIHCKNRRGGNRRGKKVTGLAFVETAQLRHREQQPCDPSLVPTTPAAGGGGGGLGAAPSRGSQVGGKADSMSAQYSLLSTTNDSRLRVYDLDNFAMVRCVPVRCGELCNCSTACTMYSFLLMRFFLESGRVRVRFDSSPMCVSVSVCFCVSLCVLFCPFFFFRFVLVCGVFFCLPPPLFFFFPPTTVQYC